MAAGGFFRVYYWMGWNSYFEALWRGGGWENAVPARVVAQQRKQKEQWKEIHRAARQKYQQRQRDGGKRLYARVTSGEN
jgi:hypothetical protein